MNCKVNVVINVCLYVYVSSGVTTCLYLSNITCWTHIVGLFRMILSFWIESYNQTTWSIWLHRKRALHHFSWVLRNFVMRVIIPNLVYSCVEKFNRMRVVEIWLRYENSSIRFINNLIIFSKEWTVSIIFRNIIRQL